MTHEAGPQLDAAIFHAVLGRPETLTHNHVDQCWVYGVGGCHRVPSYSTDIRAAWQIVEKLCADNWRFSLRNVLGTQWECQLWRGLEEEAEVHFVETAPLAICQCALAALAVAPGGREGGEG